MEQEKKAFRLSADQIRPLVSGKGACFATDMITVDGLKVGCMYREAPDNDIDSGWRFTAGRESEAYMDDPDRHGIYDVNTIANYDPDILPHLDAPPGSAFGRDPESSKSVWSLIAPNVGTSLIPVTVTVKVRVTALTPPLDVPPSSVTTTVMSAVPFTLATGE
jgi:hypothetical protein